MVDGCLVGAIAVVPPRNEDVMVIEAIKLIYVYIVFGGIWLIGHFVLWVLKYIVRNG